MFYQAVNATIPLNPPVNIVDGKGHTYGSQYLRYIKSWAAKLTGLPHNDYIMVFTGYVYPIIIAIIHIEILWFLLLQCMCII